jgi:hypothetical protein
MLPFYPPGSKKIFGGVSKTHPAKHHKKAFVEKDAPCPFA